MAEARALASDVWRPLVEAGLVKPAPLFGMLASDETTAAGTTPCTHHPLLCVLQNFTSAHWQLKKVTGLLGLLPVPPGGAGTGRQRRDYNDSAPDPYHPALDRVYN